MKRQAWCGLQTAMRPPFGLLPTGLRSEEHSSVLSVVQRPPVALLPVLSAEPTASHLGDVVMASCCLHTVSEVCLGHKLVWAQVGYGSIKTHMGTCDMFMRMLAWNMNMRQDIMNTHGSMRHEHETGA